MYDVCGVIHLLRSFQGAAFFIPGPEVVSLLQRIMRKAATDIYEYNYCTVSATVKSAVTDNFA